PELQCWPREWSRRTGGKVYHRIQACRDASSGQDVSAFSPHCLKEAILLDYPMPTSVKSNAYLDFTSCCACRQRT
ncbi:UNVERIFIED_CONTAM: hypothetical protein NY603_25315, partial [Bacteroidetes bacterium 56_B9]